MRVCHSEDDTDDGHHTHLEPQHCPYGVKNGLADSAVLNNVTVTNNSVTIADYFENPTVCTHSLLSKDAVPVYAPNCTLFVHSYTFLDARRTQLKASHCQTCFVAHFSLTANKYFAVQITTLKPRLDLSSSFVRNAVGAGSATFPPSRFLRRRFYLFLSFCFLYLFIIVGLRFLLRSTSFELTLYCIVLYCIVFLQLSTNSFRN